MRGPWWDRRIALAGVKSFPPRVVIELTTWRKLARIRRYQYILRSVELCHRNRMWLYAILRVPSQPKADGSATAPVIVPLCCYNRWRRRYDLFLDQDPNIDEFLKPTACNRTCRWARALGGGRIVGHKNRSFWVATCWRMHFWHKSWRGIL